MFRLTILNNEQVIYEGMALSAILPGAEEEIAILPFHTSLIGRLKKGMIRITGSPSAAQTPPSQADSNEIRHPAAPERIANNKQQAIGEENRIPIKDGIAWMDRNELIILCEI